MMGHTIFGTSQEILLNLVRENMEKSGSFIITSHCSPCMRNDNDRALALKVHVNCNVKHTLSTFISLRHINFLNVALTLNVCHYPFLIQVFCNVFIN